MNVLQQTRKKRYRPGWAPLCSAAFGIAVLTLADGAAAQSQAILDYAAAVGTPTSDDRGPAEGEPKFGGTLDIAVDREHPHFDPMLTTENHVIEVSNHIAEALFSIDADGVPALSLAESYEVSEDGTVYTIKIREGVPFHNGKILTSADVVASLNRYLEFGTYGRTEVVRNVESVTAIDDYTVQITLNRAFPFILYQLSAPIGGAPFIYPSELIEAVGNKPITEPIGTGPYRFVSYQENVALRMERFDDYVGRTDPPSGFAGGRVAYIDEIVIHYVPDEAVRVAGLQTGEYDMAIGITPDLHSLYSTDPSLRMRIVLSTWPCFNFNKQSGPMTNQSLRKAFRTAIDVTTIAAALGPSDFVTLDPSLFFPGSPWHSSVGEEEYLTQDIEAAKALLAEAGYANEPIRVLVDPSRAHLYTPIVVAQPMLEEAGFNIELVPVDSATYSEFRGDPDRMDVFACAYSPRQDPSLMVALGSNHPGWWDTEEKTQLLQTIQLETDQEVRLQAWADLQAHLYDYAPLMKIANLAEFNMESAAYSGAWLEVAQRYHINTWMNE